jgi:prophage regulatory protein
MSNDKPEKLIRRPQVQEITGLGRSTIYDLILSEKFPRPVKLGRASAWPLSEVQDWVRQQIAAR